MKLRVGRRLSFAALIAVCALALAACGEKKDALSAPSGSDQPLSLMLDWVPNADHVGIYQALREGDFTKAGLNVHVEIPSDPATPLNLVAAGKVDIAISYEPELLLARNRGLPLVSVAALVQKPLTSIVSIGKQHIRTPANLRGIPVVPRAGEPGGQYRNG